MSYKIKLPLFEGPLDLLLYLVKKEHMNIYDIPIARVTEQYMQYIELMQSLDLSLAGDFLVMAATLMQIKSKMLLPANEEQAQEPEEDPRADLVKQLIEYERFKEVAQELRQRETSQQEIFRRPRLQEKDIPEVVQSAPYFEASIFDLISAFSRALAETPKDIFYNVIKDEFTVEDKIHDILHDLLLRPFIMLPELFASARSKIEIVVTFLAVLELVRMKEISCLQKEAFGDIQIVRNENNIIPYEGTEQPENN